MWGEGGRPKRITTGTWFARQRVSTRPAVGGRSAGRSDGRPAVGAGDRWSGPLKVRPALPITRTVPSFLASWTRAAIMALGCVAAWWLMGVPGLIGWIAGAWGGMSAATPFEADEDDANDAADPGDWDYPAAAGVYVEDRRLTEVDSSGTSRRPPLAAVPLCCSA